MSDKDAKVWSSYQQYALGVLNNAIDIAISVSRHMEDKRDINEAVHRLWAARSKLAKQEKDASEDPETYMITVTYATRKDKRIR